MSENFITMKSRVDSIMIIFICCLIISCSSKADEPPVEEEVEARTPVTVTYISQDTLEETVSLNATSSFLQKSYVKATANGYIKGVTVTLGKAVSAGQNLFTLKTKEAESLGNTINKIDPSFRFTGIINIKSNASGYITQLDHQAGDYVQDGEQLAVISNRNSFVFMLNVPYEMKASVNREKTLIVILPDGEKIPGYVSSSMPGVDSASQTQTLLIKVKSDHPIPENLIAKVNVLKNKSINTTSLPKSAVLADETQTDFWVMKLVDSSTAVKVPVTIGIQSDERVEIVEPAFSPNDQILLTGNYGLSDTAKVIVVKKP